MRASINMKTSYLETLQFAKNLIKTGWCQGIYACNKLGQTIEWHDKGATKFCLEAALLRSQLHMSESYVNLPWFYSDCYKLFIGHFQRNFTSWNDVKNRKKEEVLVAINKLMELVQEKIV